MMKLFKRKHFQSLIYSIFLALPLLSVVGRTIYTIANKNAKDSYYGETINEIEQVYLNDNDISLTETYYINYSDLNYTTSGGNIYVHNFDFVSTGNLSTANYNLIMSNQTSIYRLYFGYNNNVQRLNLYKLNDDNTQSYVYAFYPTDAVIIKFNIYSLDNTSASNIGQFVYYFEYNNYSYLDNAFEYSIHRFVSENDYGNLDFFSWFSSLFLSSNSLNSLYIHFINWYMNYILYVSLGYLIFSVLLWFVNFFRKLVDNTQNINVGGL